MAVNSYLDQYKEYISQSYVVISDIGIELALSIEQGNLDSESLNSLLGYVLFSRNVIDIQATFDQRLDPLTAMVNQAPLLPVPIPLGYLGNINIYPPSIPPLLSHSQLLNILGPGELHLDDLLLNKLINLPFNYGWDDIVGNNPLINAPLAAIISGLEPAFPASGNPARYLNGTKVFSQVQFSHLGGVPTTLAGYGISSSDTLFDGRYLRANTVLSTYSLGSNTTLNNTQSVVQMFGNVQGQINAREPALGNPTINGYILSSTTAGVRSWVPFAGGGTLNSVTINTLNGFAGNAIITAGNAAITLRTSISGLLKGDGNAISAATEMTDYIGITGAATGDTVIFDGTVATWAPAFNNPMEEIGDLIIGGAFGETTRLPGNSTAVRKFLMSVGVFGVIQPQTYATLIASDIPEIPISRVTNLQTTLDQRLSDNLLSGRIFIGNTSDLATGVVPSGDWTITTAGVNTIGANKVTFAKFQQASGPQILVGTPDILGVQDFRQITLDPLTLQIDASGQMSSIATGTGTVTNTNTLTLNSLVLGDGGTAVKVGGGFTTDGVSQLTLGVSGTSVGGLLLTNITSGTIELRPVTGALGTTVLTLFAGSDTLVGLAATQTLTNKTLTNPQINGALLQTSSTVGYVWTATNTTGAGSWQAPTGGGGTTTNSLTIDNSGTGAASGTTFNGSAARTISSNTILPSFTGNNGLYLRLNSSTGLPEWASAGGGGSGTVLSVSVVSANGFAGTVATDTTTPAITLTTSVTGILKGSGGALVAATAGTDYLTSVGLTMPSAFTVTTSPLTANGTLAVTGAGTVSQYIRGDGTLANFPTSGGGGASLSYYLNGSVSQGTFGGVACKEISSTPILGGGTDFTINANGYIQSFITDANIPNQLLIPAGNWNFETYFSASSTGGSPSFYIELYKYDGTTLTLIASNSTNPESITGGTNIDLYFTALAVPETILTATDRLVVRFYVNHSGRTITMHTEGSHLSQIITTFTTGLTAFNGLTAQVQFLGAVGTTGTAPAWTSTTETHTLNIPLASAASVTAGLISKTEYDTFAAKMANPMTAEGDIIYGDLLGVPIALARGSDGKFLTLASGVPVWGTVPSMVYPGAGIANSTGTSWGTSYTTTGSGTVLALATGPTLVTPIVTGVATFGNGTSAGEIRLLEGSGSGSNFVALKSPATLGADLSLTFPNTTPGSGQTLVSDGSGVLSWSSNPGTTNSIYRRAYGGTVVNTTPETLLQSLLVPANTFTDGVGWQVMATASRTNPGSNAVTFKFYINTTAAIGGVALAGTGYFQTGAAGSSSFHFCRLGFVQIASGGSRITVFVPSTASTNYALPGGTLLSSAIDWSVDQYFILTVAQTSAVSTVTCNSMQLIPQ